MLKRPVTAIVVGAGNRGMGYSSYALRNPDELRIVGVAEPSDRRRAIAAETFDIPPEMCFGSAEELAERQQMADAVINGTMEMEHVSTAIPLMAAGYDMLLEKPFATLEADMWRLVRASREHRRKLMICHVLRYAPFYRAIKERVAAGQVGEVINIQTNEHVSYHHMAVAFVRGKWKSQAETGSSFLMAKCCHDLDLIMWLKAGSGPVAVSSFGSRSYFRAENAPPGAGTRCLVDCAIEADCLYSARKHYLDHPDRWAFYVWSELEDVSRPTDEQRSDLLRTSDYGRCVWGMDNDVVDRQAVAMEFDDGTTATHNMVGGTARPSRSIHLVGTIGEIQGVFEDQSFVVRHIDPGTEYSEERVDTDVSGDMQGAFGGHGGGDMRLVEDFVSLVQGKPRSISCTSLDDSISSHLVGFAADAAMEERRVVELADF
jgi:predicted dehydrogenase